ncbi:MAG: NADH-quinone oxidoreductase subunit N [Chloroflexi bacterium]|nr:NADH-quinone oxidoreductase subunit N [Chloroflexota bacterium]
MDFEYELVVPEFVMAGLATLIVAVALCFPRLRQELLGYGAAAAVLLLLVLTAVFYINVNDDFANIIAVDNYTVLFRIFFLGIAFFTILASMQFAADRLKNHGEYYGLILFATLGMMLMAGARELITAYIALELLSFSLYILVGFNKLNPFSNEASLKYMLLGAFSSALFLYGLSMIYGVTGTTTYGPIDPDGVEAARNIATQLGNFGAAIPDPALPAAADVRPGLIIGLVLVVAGLGFKVSAVPFHQWTPDAYQGAPLPITAFLSAGGKAAAFALFLRLFAEAFMPASAEWVWLVAIVAAGTMIVGNLMALQQTNMKRLLAYSSIAQVGYLLVGIVALHADTLANSHDAASALVLHLVGYVATNIAVFAALIAFYNRTGRDDIADLRGLAERQPFLALTISVGLFSLAGMPLFAGFVTKFILFQAAADSGFLWLAAMGVTASFVSLYYYLMVIKQIYLYKPADTAASRLHVPAPMTAAIAVLTAAVFFIGLYPTPLFKAIEHSTAMLFPGA